MEHRVGQRKPVQLDVTLAGRHSAEIQGEIQNLSARGAFIKLLGDYSSLRNIVRLRFPMQTHKSGYCECWALVVRSVADGVGVMFDQLQEFSIEQPQEPAQPKRVTKSLAEATKATESAGQLESATQ